MLLTSLVAPLPASDWMTRLRPIGSASSMSKSPGYVWVSPLMRTYAPSRLPAASPASPTAMLDGYGEATDTSGRLMAAVLLNSEYGVRISAHEPIEPQSPPA